MNGLSKFKKGFKRVSAMTLSALMAAGCLEAAGAAVSITADAASGTLSNAERGVIYANSRSDFRDESIYFVMTTRFYNGDTSNDVQCWEVNQETGSYKSSYDPDDPAWRGDFKGLAEKLDYIKALGFTAIWITPVVENCSGYDYHGYHAINFQKVDPRYESNDFTYQDLINAVHAKGMKLIQDVVYNHTGNFGETNLCPMFEKEGDLSSPDCLKLASNTALPSNYFDLDPDAQYQARLALMKDTDGVHHDINNIYHHYGNFNWDDYTCQLAQIAGDCVDLNTENPLVYNYLVQCYTNYINMGVDAFRVDTVRHISRLTLNKAFNQALLKASEKSRDLRNGYDFFMFGEVCCRDNGNYWYRQNPGMSTPYYTWKTAKDDTYAWSEDPAQWETNYNSAMQNTIDNENNIGEQPTSTNAFLNGNDYHKPDYSQFSGLSVIDFPMHWSFRDAGGAFSVATRGDQYYNDATWNVTYVDSHDYAPDNAPENQRFAGDQSTWAENLSLIFSFRGIPCIYYGSEIEFQKGCTIDKGPLIKLSESGRAYYGDHIDGSVVTSDFTVFNATGSTAETLSHPLAQHIIRLNRIRQAIPALRKGQYSTEGCSGSFAFKRRYTDSKVDSFALVTISGSATFSGIPNGTYVDAVTGDTKTVSNGTLTASCSGKGNLRVYVLNGPGRVVPNGQYITDGGAAETIGNENVEIVEPTGISLSASRLSVREGESSVLKATITPSNATYQNVTWTSSNPSVATVSGGNIVGLSIGTTTIKASTYDNKYSATCTVTVTENTSIVKPTGINADKSSLELVAGSTGQITATVLPSDATNKTVTWSSDNESVAKVNSSGTVTAVAEGVATITAATFNGYKATCTVTVTPKQFTMVDKGFYFEKPSGWGNTINVYMYDISKNTTIGADWPGTKMTDMGEGVYSLEYTSSESNLRMIFNDGSNQSPGRDIEGFKLVDQGYYTVNGYDHTVEKQQTVEVTSVSVSPSSLSLTVGSTGTISATVAPSNASNKTVSYTSSNTSVATVTSSGTVTAVAAGTATITAKSNNGKTATVSVTVTKKDDPVSTLTNNTTVSKTSFTVGEAVTVKGAASGGSGSYSYEFYYKRSTASSWTKFGSNGTGTFQPGSAGTFTIRTYVKDSAGKSAMKDFTVTAAAPSLTNKTTVSKTSFSVGETITVKGAASGGSGSYSYEFYYKRSTASSWTKFGSNGTGTFKPGSAGTFTIRTYAKDSAGKSAMKDFSLTATAASLTNNTTVSKTSFTVGETITVKGAASGGSGSYSYEFYYKRSTASSWTKFGSNGTGTFKPGSAGTFTIRTYAKDSAGKSAMKDFSLTATAPTFTNNTTVNKTNIKVGEIVTVKGAASNGNGSYSYEFYYRRSTVNTWTKFDSDGKGIFQPGSAGTFYIRTYAKDSSGKAAVKDFTVTATAGTLTNKTTVSKTSFTVGDTIVVAGGASGGNGNYSYEFYCQREGASSWTKFGSDGLGTFSPRSAGSFFIKTYAKDSAGKVGIKEFALTAK